MAENYRSGQVKQVLDETEEGAVFAVKVRGGVDSKWLNVTAFELKLLAAIMDGSDNADD